MILECMDKIVLYIFFFYLYNGEIFSAVSDVASSLAVKANLLQSPV